MILKKNRLKRISSVQQLQEKDMLDTILVQVLQRNEISNGLEKTVFRKLLNEEKRYVVEIWKLIGGGFAVFSGYFDGYWTVDDIEFHSNQASEDKLFDDEGTALAYVQTNLMQFADNMENVMASKKYRLKKISNKDLKITKAKIVTSSDKDIPFSETNKVVATLENGEVVELFYYYADEITFKESELIGLTVEQARELKLKKDKDYLRYEN